MYLGQSFAILQCLFNKKYFFLSNFLQSPIINKTTDQLLVSYGLQNSPGCTGSANCQTQDLPILPSQAIDWKNLEAFIFGLLFGWLFGCLWSRWGIGDVHVIHTFSWDGHSIKYSGPDLEHILNISRTYLGYIWDISGTYMKTEISTKLDVTKNFMSPKTKMAPKLQWLSN